MSQLSEDFGGQGEELRERTAVPHTGLAGRIAAKHQANEVMSEDAWGVILDGTVPENSPAEHCTTKTWALGPSAHTSKSELPRGFKRLQLPCYKP